MSHLFGHPLDFYTEALQLARQLSDWRLATHCVAGLASVAATTDDPQRAGRLMGAMEVFDRELGWTLLDAERHSYDRAALACADRHPQDFAAGVEAGRMMTPDEILNYALGSPTAPQHTAQ